MLGIFALAPAAASAQQCGDWYVDGGEYAGDVWALTVTSDDGCGGYGGYYVHSYHALARIARNGFVVADVHEYAWQEYGGGYVEAWAAFPIMSYADEYRNVHAADIECTAGGYLFGDETAYWVALTVPSISLVASASSVFVGTPVSITAYLYPYETHPGLIVWDGATAEPYANDIAWVDTSSPGVKFVMASIPGAGNDAITVEVEQQPPPPPSCTHPTLIPGRQGVRRGAVYTYWFHASMTNQAERDGVDAAFKEWSSANQGTGTNATFVPQAGSGDIQVSKEPLQGPGQMSTFLSGAGGYAVGGEMKFSDDPMRLTGQTQYLKYALHELGHFHGLADATGVPPRSTVMFDPTAPQDAADELPQSVQPCDASQAFAASVP